MAEPTTAWCTVADVEARFSELGVDYHTDDDAASGTRACLRATREVYFYLSARYNDADLEGSGWVEERVIDLATYYIDTRRADPAGEPVLKDYERAIELLEKVQRAELNIGALPLRKARGGVPSLSNQRVKLGPIPVVVTERKKSTGDPRDYRKFDDRTEWYDPGAQ